MQLHDWISVMERIAPKERMWPEDNCGLLLTPAHPELRRVMVALDCTEAVAGEAAEWGADLVLTHHPLFFHSVRHILVDDPETAVAYRLLRSGIGLYAAHTTFDAAEGGVSDVIAAALGLTRVRIVEPDGFCRVGSVEPCTLRTLAARAEAAFACPVSVLGDSERTVGTVACMGGSGASGIGDASAAGAEVLVTGELKHSDLLKAQSLGLSLILGGHHETECIALPGLIDRLQHETNDVQYQLARADVSPLWRP